MGIFDAFNNSLNKDNHLSPFGEAGLLGDPLHYIVGDKYDNFMRKTWEMPNQYAGQYLTKFDKFDRKINPIHRAIDRTAIGGKIADYAHNKPGDSLMAVLGAVYGGGALMAGGGGGSAGGGMVGGGSASGGNAGGMLGNMFGGGGGQGLGIFSNSGQAGMSGVGGGNAGALAASHGIGGGAGLGTAGTGAGAGTVGFSSNPQSYMRAAQGMPGQQQQQQQQGPKPYWYRGRVVYM